MQIQVPFKTINLYNWYDIQNTICDVMGIPHDMFRDYHKVVGGEYKDLWHVALDCIIPDNMANDTIVKLWAFEEYVSEIDMNDEYGLAKVIRDNGDWVIPFLEAYEKVITSIVGDTLDCVYVQFCW